MTVIPFVARASRDGWTDSERARLHDLADKLAAKAGPVNISFGVSDRGEPWCVVTDADDEVLIHAARIDGRFVIHDAAADILRVGDTLWSACDRLLGPDWRDPREDVVVSLNQRQAQSVLAIALLADFVYEIADAKAEAAPAAVAVRAQAAATATFIMTADLAGPAVASAADEPPSAQAPDGPSPSAVSRAEDPAAGGDAVEAAHLIPEPEIEAAPMAGAAPGEPSTPVQPQGDDSGRTVVGGDGNDLLMGGAGDDDIQGGAGDDTAAAGDGDDRIIGGDDDDLLLGQAGDDVVYGNFGDDSVEGGEGADWLRGGKGDDSVAGGDGDDFISGDRGSDTLSGGAGADLFNVIAGAGLDRVLDFSASEGDRVHVEEGVAYAVSQVGADTVVRLARESSGDEGQASEVVLVNVTLATLPEGWIG